MKTNVIRVVFATVLLATIGSFSASAQSEYNFFFDRKYEGEKIVSKTKYELNDGLFEKTYHYEYSYNDWGQLTKEETFRWNTRKSIWEPVCCTEHLFDVVTNTMTLEYKTWNKKSKQYNETSLYATYSFDTDGNLFYYAQGKGKDKPVEKITMF